jgi:hypothetical protein
MLFYGEKPESIVKLTCGGGEGERKNDDDEKLSTTSAISQTLYLATFYGGNDLHASL